MVCRERYPDVNPQTQNFSKNKGLFSAKGSRAAIDSTPIKRDRHHGIGRRSLHDSPNQGTPSCEDKFGDPLS
jgi:hypothetical protein